MSRGQDAGHLGSDPGDQTSHHSRDRGTDTPQPRLRRNQLFLVFSADRGRHLTNVRAVISVITVIARKEIIKSVIHFTCANHISAAQLSRGGSKGYISRYLEWSACFVPHSVSGGSSEDRRKCPEARASNRGNVSWAWKCGTGGHHCTVYSL